MVQQAQNLFLCLDISIEIGAKHSLFSNSFESIKLLLCSFTHEIDLTKCPFSNFFEKFKGGKSNCFNFLILSYKLIHLKDILFSPELCLFFVLFLFSRDCFFGGFILEHFLHHTSMVRSVTIEDRFVLFGLIFLENLRDLR